MAAGKQQDVPAAPASESAIVGAFGQLLGGVQELVEQGKRGRQVPFHEATFKTPFNPDGKRERPKLKFPHFYQNGARCNPKLMTDEEIRLANQLKPGRYFNGKWEVRRRNDKSLELRYPHSTIAHRMDLKFESGGNMASMLQKILVEQEAREQARKSGRVLAEDDDYS